MNNESRSNGFDQKVEEAARGVEIIKINKENEKSSDHRDRPHNQYSEEFKRRVALAANVPGVKLTWVGLRFNVLPEIVETWKKLYNDKL